jgi:hypothetical protein
MTMKPLFSRSILALAIALAAAPITAGAAPGGFSLFGDAQLVSPGNGSPTGVQLRSTFVPAGFGGIDFAVPSGTTFGSITNLATDYFFTQASCGGGSPRFQINVDGKNAFVYVGPPPSYTGCAMTTWLPTGNLATPDGFVDTSQLPGGNFYDTFTKADAKYGTHAVTGVQLVTDSGWFFKSTQTVVVDNVMINNTTYTFESKDLCKDGGWENFKSAPGPFSNQGDCVSFFASGGNS